MELAEAGCGETSQHLQKDFAGFRDIHDAHRFSEAREEARHAVSTALDSSGRWVISFSNSLSGRQATVFVFCDVRDLHLGIAVTPLS